MGYGRDVLTKRVLLTIESLPALANVSGLIAQASRLSAP